MELVPLTPEREDVEEQDDATLARTEAQMLERRGALFRPLASYARDPDETPGIPFGLPELDSALLGGLREGLHMVVGFSHHGKTLLLLRLLWENRNKPIVVFTPDEASEAVMYKLINLAIGTTMEEAFVMSANRKAGIIKEFYPWLAVDDMNRGKYDMVTYVQEAEDFWGRAVELVAYDYLSYFGSQRGSDDQTGAIDQKASAFKELVKDTRKPWLVIHQANRQAAKGDGKMDVTKVAYGGVAQMETITSVRQQVFDPKLDLAGQRQEAHQRTVHVALLKNKQSYKYVHGGAPGTEVQLAIDKESGLIRPMEMRDRMMSGLRDLRLAQQGRWEETA